MVGIAFVVGFFTALGWWSANKLTKEIDKQIEPQPTVQRIDKNDK